MVKVLSSPSPLLPSASMSQSGLMVAALLGGFVVYVALAGKLANYWSILLGGGSTGATATPAATTTAPATTTTPATSSPSSTATTTSPFGLPSSIFPALGGTANPFAATTGGTVGFNATKPGAFSGLTAGSLFSGGA